MKDFLSSLFFDAFECFASDIHIEPEEDFVLVRFRIDGILIENQKIPRERLELIVSAIKIMANLDISETRFPQDGRTNVLYKENNYDLRISIIPTVKGEKAVIRILNRRELVKELDSLGMSKEVLIPYNKLISKKSGLILIVGPTGSGKTTTLYATLKQLKTSEKNIVTLEDPVEYRLPGITQIQVNHKIDFSFEKILKAVLRQDPDILFVGEIRNSETAKIAVQAALTGHLVFSTLHTKDTSSAFNRMIDLGVEEYLLRETLLCVVAQRLIKKKRGGRTAVFEFMGNDFKRGKTLLDEALKLVDLGISEKKDIAYSIDL